MFFLRSHGNTLFVGKNGALETESVLAAEGKPGGRRGRAEDTEGDIRIIFPGNPENIFVGAGGSGADVPKKTKKAAKVLTKGKMWCILVSTYEEVLITDG